MLSTSAIIGSKAKVVAPSAPTGLTILDNGIGYTAASWNSVTGATKYEVRYNVNLGGWGSVIDRGTNLSHTNGPWLDGTSVCVQVRVTTSGGTSVWSLSQCVITSTGGECGIDFPTCLPSNTLITMANELKEISNIKEGDMIVSQDEDTGELFDSEVLDVRMTNHDKMIRITFEDGSEINCTVDHPWKAEEVGWVSYDTGWTGRYYKDIDVISKLERGQTLIGMDLNKVIKDIVPYIQELETYQIMKLSKGSTYFANGLLTKIEK